MNKFEAFTHLIIVGVLLYFSNVLIKNPNAYNTENNLAIIIFSLLYTAYVIKSRKHG